MRVDVYRWTEIMRFSDSTRLRLGDEFAFFLQEDKSQESLYQSLFRRLGASHLGYPGYYP